MKTYIAGDFEIRSSFRFEAKSRGESRSQPLEREGGDLRGTDETQPPASPANAVEAA